MRTFIRTLLISVSFSFLVACGGGGPIGKAINHEKAMLKIVESNKDDGEKAKVELEKYVADNKAEIDGLKAEMEKLEKEIGDDDAKQMEAIAPHMDALMENEKIRDGLRESKAYDNEDVRKLLRTVKM